MSAHGAVGVGLIGAGMISDQYLSNIAQYPDLEVVAVGDLLADRAAAQAAKYGISASGDAASVLADPDVEIVINLTIPAAHVEISTAALQAGKHVWSEKPIGVDRASALALVELARERGLLLGIAPDTVLGPVWQTAKRAIAGGLIGEPISAVTSFQSQGPEYFHPNPGFLFAQGAGPLFDLGPYYLSALVQLLGPVAEVMAVGTRAAERRTILVGPHAGESFPVEVWTHLAVATTFASGVSGSSLMSADTALHRHGIFEINGTEGTLVLGDPNYFGGWELKLYRPVAPGAEDPGQSPELISAEGPLYGRGVGATAMARTLRGADLHIATGEFGYHVLDVMASIEESVARRAFVQIDSTVTPAPALPAGFDPFTAPLVSAQAV